MARSSTTFQRGISGNPGGRPKVIGEVRDLARAYTVEAIETLNSIMSDKRAPAAAQAILDRGYGRPSHHMSIEEQRPMALGVMINIQWWQFMVGLPTRSVADGIQQKPNGQSMRKG